ncbi:283a8dec-2c10-498f-b239-95128c8f25b0 [Thermothielavioides terrestris]|uniref:283a8dec-2c10-498f-b239-95128c8f25b0 n=1 Tax=Thermothielavioides terrestris TaxID=2587410 RepID=A0A3S4AXB9_9PEZI|nr:283a8dec-2c10-498f-b239-95128c8f25b0 [Thermothielavioides terrestris]
MEKSKRSADKGAEEPSSMRGVQAAAAASGFVLSGTMLGMFITIPVILDTQTDALQICRQWARAFHYGHVAGPGLCGATLLLHLYAAFGGRKDPGQDKAKAKAARKRQLVAGLATMGMVPYTWLTMSSTNNALFAQLAGGAADLASVRHLVGVWSWLHFVRCMFPLTGAILGLGVFL